MHLQLAGQIEALQVTVGGGLFSWTEQKEPNFFSNDFKQWSAKPF